MNKKTVLPSDVDPLVLGIVTILNEHGFKTFESCQGGDGHCFPEPTVRFEGDEFDIIRACELCRCYGVVVNEGRRVFRQTPVYKDENSPNAVLVGYALDKPFNEITFSL